MPAQGSYISQGLRARISRGAGLGVKCYGGGQFSPEVTRLDVWSLGTRCEALLGGSCCVETTGGRMPPNQTVPRTSLFAAGMAGAN